MVDRHVIGDQVHDQSHVAPVQRLGQPLVELIEQCLAQDPKPAYQQPAPERRYAVQFWDVDVCWHYPERDCIRVMEVRYRGV